MNIIEAIKERRSVRSFNGEHLRAELISALNTSIDESSSPFGGHTTIRLISFDIKGGFRPSTYGMITGATDYFLIAAEKGRPSALSVGYRFEQVVLKAWQMGLGTCWIAATFKGSDFERGQTWPEGEELMIVCPVGIAAKVSIKDKLARIAVGSKHRKPFGSLFFQEDFDTPLSSDSTFGEALEMMRLAPSSTNSQPWRGLIMGDTVRFYCKQKGELSFVDCGIGLCHFHAAETFLGHQGSFFEESDIPLPPKGLTYITSYRRIANS